VICPDKLSKENWKLDKDLCLDLAIEEKKDVDGGLKT